MQTVACVTGRLAERALRQCLADLATPDLRFEVVVLPITVAALMTAGWIAAHLEPGPDWDRILLPGLCPGD
ncbi:MAG TPA: DUF6513 domain-containing protein, partial [Symbiobacteriaceae bacterium]|nr:DUF6513 domain-containing protein [Symbiobacteriaceae bacterium]